MKRKFLFSTILSICFSVSFLLSNAFATQIQLDFSAGITSVYENFTDFISGDTFSGYFLYDSDTVLTDTYSDPYAGDSFLFDFLWNPASIYIDQLNSSYDLSLWVNQSYEGSYTETYLQTNSQETLFLGLSFTNITGEAPFSDPSSLPTSIDQTAVSEGYIVGSLYLEGASGFGFADLAFTLLEVPSTPLPDLPPPALNAEGALLLGGAGLASGARINEGDSDLITTRTVVGYESDGTFVQTGALHETETLSVGGDPVDYTAGRGEYIMSDGELVTHVTQVGYRDVGEFTQTGGSHTTDYLFLGNVGTSSLYSGPRARGVGTYSLESGTLESRYATVGASGQGTFNQSGGTHAVGTSWYPSTWNGAVLTIGNNISQYNPDDYEIPEEEKSYGVYNMSGGDLTVYGSVVLGAGSDNSTYRYGGTGFFNQSGGTSTMRGLIIGEPGTAGSGEGHVAVSGTALMNVSGDILVGSASANAPAVATFEQTGGEVFADGQILIGESAAGAQANSYRILGGQTTAGQGVIVGTDEVGIGQAQLEVSNGGVLIANVAVKSQGLLNGSDGTIIGNVSLDGGTIAPGNSPGTMTIDGNLLLDKGTLELEAFSPEQQDLLNVSESVYFGNDLTVNLVMGYKPSDTFEIESFFNAGSGLFLGDTFDPVTSILFFLDGIDLIDGETFSYSLGGQEYQYTHASPVPLPGSAWYLLTGILGLVVVNTRKQAGKPA